MKDVHADMPASGRNGTIDTGMTNNRLRRVSGHREEIIKDFTTG